MTKQNRAVFGIYRDRMHVERAVEILLEAGFRNTDISVLTQSHNRTARAKNRRVEVRVFTADQVTASLGGSDLAAR